MPLDDILMDCEEQMEKAVDHLKHELRSIRTGRASPALVENVKKPSTTPIQQRQRRRSRAARSGPRYCDRKARSRNALKGKNQAKCRSQKSGRGTVL